MMFRPIRNALLALEAAALVQAIRFYACGAGNLPKRKAYR